MSLASKMKYIGLDSIMESARFTGAAISKGLSNTLIKNSPAGGLGAAMGMQFAMNAHYMNPSVRLAMNNGNRKMASFISKNATTSSLFHSAGAMGSNFFTGGKAGLTGNQYMARMGMLGGVGAVGLWGGVSAARGRRRY